MYHTVINYNNLCARGFRAINFQLVINKNLIGFQTNYII